MSVVRMKQSSLFQYFPRRVVSCRYRVVVRKETKFRQTRFYKLKGQNGFTVYNPIIMSKKVSFSDKLDTQDLDDLFAVETEEIVECGDSSEALNPDIPLTSSEEEDLPHLPEVPIKKMKRDLPHSSSQADSKKRVQHPQHVNSKKKGKSPSNPRKGKAPLTSTCGQASTTQSQRPTSEGTSSTQRTFLQVILLYLTGQLCGVWKDLQEVWEIETATLLAEETPRDYLQEILELMAELITILKQSPEDQSFISCGNVLRNTLLQRSMSPTLTEYTRDFLNRFKIARERMQSQHNIAENNSSQSVSTITDNPITTPCTSVPGTAQTAAVVDSSLGGATHSPTDIHIPSAGWRMRPSSMSSYITWADPEYVYTVRSPDNRGDFIVKTEIYATSQVRDLPAQEWWKYPLHRSRVELSANSTDLEHLRQWTNHLENLWVDKHTGVPKKSGVAQEMVLRRNPPARREGPSTNRSGPTF